MSFFFLFMSTKKLQKTKRTNTKHLVPHGRRTYLQGTAHLNKKYNGKMKKQTIKQTKKERSYVEICHMCKYLQQRDIESFGRFQKLILFFSTEEFCSTL